MDLNLLSQFEAVARTKSFSLAARELGLPKSTVSRGVARLEAELSLQLFFRTTRQVSLSTAGAELYDRIVPLLRGVQAALGDLPEQEEEPSGLLRVTGPVDLGLLFLAEAAARYTARYPAASIEISLTGRVVDLVAEGFDLALRVASQLEDSTLVVRRAAQLRSRLFASPVYLARHGTPRTEEDLAQHDRVVFRPASQALRPSAAKEDASGHAHGRIFCDDVAFARDAVRAGAGIGLLPSFLAEADVTAGRLVRVLPRYERPSSTLFIVTPAARHVPRKVTAFRELLLEQLGARVGAG